MPVETTVVPAIGRGWPGRHWQMHRYEHGDGVLMTYGGGAAFEPGGAPVLLVLHGALRNAEVLMQRFAPWSASFDIVFADLPGHGRSSPVLPATVEAFALRAGSAMQAKFPGRDLFVLGESLGGLVALAMGGQGWPCLRGVIAADPPLTTAKLWHVAQAVRTALTRSPGHPFMESFAAEIFGIARAAVPAERIYYPVLDRLRVPALMLTGDTPLLPPRQTASVPCVMDEVDRFVIERLYRDRVSVEVLDRSGHLVLFDAAAECRAHIECFITGAVSPPA